MRRLVLMRHAKTESHNLDGDHSRHLTKGGIQDAQDAGVALRALGIDSALVSTATRTRETFTHLGLDVTAHFLDDLYFGGTDTAARLIAATPDTTQALLVVGHAPTIPDLAATLLFASDPAEADGVGGWFPTSAYSTFTFDGPWKDLFGDSPLGYEGTVRQH